uniref:Cysteine/serine-rich nuclear protein 2 n=1 Tax=Cacopsylla melanoneura TaxID=428564 RepID=A0A8D8VV29_9HEMI
MEKCKMKEPIQGSRETQSGIAVEPSGMENNVEVSITSGTDPTLQTTNSIVHLDDNSYKEPKDCLATDVSVNKETNKEANNNSEHLDLETSIITSNSNTGYSNENKTSDSNSKCKQETVDSPGTSNVIDKTNRVPLVNSQITNHDQGSTNVKPGIEVDFKDENLKYSTNDLRSYEDIPSQTVEEASHPLTKQVVNESLSLQAPNINSPATLDTNNRFDTEASATLHADHLSASVAATNEEQCTSIPISNVNNSANEINHLDTISDVNYNQTGPETLTSNICKVIGKTVAKQIIEELIAQVVENVEPVQEFCTIDNENQSENEIEKEKIEGKNMNEERDQGESKEFGEERAEGGSQSEYKQEEKKYFTSKSGEDFTEGEKSEDYDEVEKSDGSDSGIGSELIDEVNSGIGSELIDEVITKSSDSSSTSSSDEFPTTAEVSTKTWTTPCMSFSEMSEDDLCTPPRLSMPTFDDLTRSPCDVFATERERKEIMEEIGALSWKSSCVAASSSSNSALPTEHNHTIIETTGNEGHESTGCTSSNGIAESSNPSKESCSKPGSDSNCRSGVDSDEDIDISSIDPEDSTPKEPEVPSSLLREIPSIPSTSRQTQFKSSLKRRAPSSSHGEGYAPPASKKRRGITFDTVSVYYFPRMQGFTCVPSQGGSTLGMSVHHSHVQTFTLGQYALEQRRVHQRMARSPVCSAESAGSLSGCDTNDDSDDEEQLSDEEFDSDSSYTLQPVKIRQRRAMLRAAGVDKIDPAEKNECKQIRISREYCGCACEGYCDPEICACAQAGIKCQVDRQNFPCGCSRDCCANPKGRIEFNPVRVHSHYIQTIMRIKAQKRDDDMSRLYDYQQFHNYHPTSSSSDFEPTSLSSYYPHHHPQYLSSHHHHHHHHHNDLLSNFELQTQMHSCYEPFNPELTTLYTHLSSGGGTSGGQGNEKNIQESLTELLPSSYSGDAYNGQSSTPDSMYTSDTMTNTYRYTTPSEPNIDPYNSYNEEPADFTTNRDPNTSYPREGNTTDYMKDTMAAFPTNCTNDYAREMIVCSGDYSRDSTSCGTDYARNAYVRDASSCGGDYGRETNSCANNYVRETVSGGGEYARDPSVCNGGYANTSGSNYQDYSTAPPCDSDYAKTMDTSCNSNCTNVSEYTRDNTCCASAYNSDRNNVNTLSDGSSDWSQVATPGDVASSPGTGAQGSSDLKSPAILPTVSAAHGEMSQQQTNVQVIETVIG